MCTCNIHFPPHRLHDRRVVDLAHEEDALGRVLADDDQEGSVESHDLRHAHWHDLHGGDRRRLCSCFIHAQHGLVGNLRRKPGGGSLVSSVKHPLCVFASVWRRVCFNPTFETLSLTSLDMPEKSAVSPKASVIPISFSVLSRAASAEMENLGRNRSTELRKRRTTRSDSLESGDTLALLNTKHSTLQPGGGKVEKKTKVILLPRERVVPVHDLLLVDAALHLGHLAFLGQDDHHGGVTLVGQPDDGGVVFSVPVEVVAAGPLHHVHLNLGGFVHGELGFVCLVPVEGFLPLSCVTQRRWEKCNVVTARQLKSS